ncbi:MAG: phenylalanine--tRNA ligase subunit beta [Bacteroidales bacterium]|nr:phenylalanine--tRNA ligase subunit beta [Bacteroidales bacterium]
MNISYNWLKDYLEFDLTPQATADALTSIGLETEGLNEIQTIKGGLEGLIIGEVLTCVPHPNSDHLHLTTVNVGQDGEPLNIVCGAPNVAPGQKVVVATVGATLYIGDEELKIKRSKIRGEESLGMICSENEIGVGNSQDGIIVLPNGAQVGMPAKEYYNVKSDYVLEVDITPNRVDATSHFGVARDLAAYLQQAGMPYKLNKPSVENFKIDTEEGGIDVDVENTEACPRYSGLTIRNVKVAESPDWLKNRLLPIGIRPINNIVDITNFVLHELGQPLHAFDMNHVKGNKVVVRTVEQDTLFTTLDEQERKLHERDLMICNAEEAMCIAGVFGGMVAGVTESTTDVFLESAYFNPTWVRKTARRHMLNTDSSFRFERGLDPNNTLYALKRAALLIQEIAGGTIEGAIRDIYPVETPQPKVELNLHKVNTLIGKEISTETIKSILNSLDIVVESETEEVLNLSIPTYRVDVLRDVDVIEEILRIYGYNNIEISDSLKSNLSNETDTDRKHVLQTLISEQLSAHGFNEIMNNSLTQKAYYAESEVYPVSNNVNLLNPLSGDLNVMRQTLLYGGLENIIHNANRKHADLNLYEFGNCYFYDADNTNPDNPIAQYTEETHLGVWLCGKRNSKNWAVAETLSSAYELKAHVENILLKLGLNDDKQLVHEPFSNELFAAGMSIGTRQQHLVNWGVVHHQVLKGFDIDTDVYFAEFNWDALMKVTRKHVVLFNELPKFPSVKRDLALLIDKSITFAEIEKIAFNSERKLLREVTLFDVYEGKHLPDGKKSYAVNFILQDYEKTLDDKRIDKIMSKIQQNLEKELGAQLR